MGEPISMENEVRHRLTESPLYSELRNELEATRRTGDAPEPSLGIGNVLAALIHQITALENCVIRLAAEIDRLRHQSAPPP